MFKIQCAALRAARSPSLAATFVVLVFVAALFFQPGEVLATQETGGIHGQVKTSDGQPVTDAVLTLAGLTAQFPVDDEGRFEIDSLVPGPQLISVSSTRHHEQAIERVEVVAGETVEIEIVLASRIHAEEIVVTAPGGPALDLDIVAPFNVLDGQELAFRVQPTVGETLSNEVGITQTYFAPGASRPLIRGLGADRIKMMENGLDTLDASSASPDHAVSADPMSVERIEVIRGPATLLYGSTAIGGAVNQLDRRIPELRPTSEFFGSVNFRGGSAADERAGSVDLNGGNDRFAWHLDYSALETDDYDIPGFARLEGEGHGDEHDEEHDEHGDDDHDDDDHDEDEHEEEENPFGTLPNSDIRSDSGGIGGTYFFGDSGFVGVSVSGFDTEYGLPGGHGHHEEEGGHDDEHDEDEHGDDEHDEDEHGEDEHDDDEHDEDEHGEEEGVRIDMERVRYDIRGAVTKPFGAFQSATFRFGYVDYEHVEGEGEGEGTAFFNDAWEARAEFVQKRRGSHKGSFGVQIRSRDFEVVGEEAFVPPAKTENLGIFTFQEFGSGPLRYQFGARYETQETSVLSDTLRDRDFDALSASFGIVRSVSDGYSIGASLARSVKMPTSEELYSDGPHFAVSAFEVGDPGLDEESALGTEISFRKTEGRVTGSINLFYNDFSDFIFQAFTGEEEDGLPVVQYSQADAEFLGGEVDLSIVLFERPHASWNLDLFGDLVRAEFDDGGDLPRIPSARFGGGIHYRSDRLRGGAEVWRVTEQDRVAENETPTDAYTMLNANISYRFFFSSYYLDLILRGTNLTDEEARMHTSFVKDSVPLPGRNISLMARLGF
ncbi:MAG: TonB-dependent receptor [Thermoanaerobaculia bacterium]|nr:TonB-dependent receptor [Thermoanaerobaculia bacterium]